MKRISSYTAVVLLLTAGAAAFCLGWFFSRASLSEPWSVAAARRPAVMEDISQPETDGYPESLLPGEVINLNTADVYELQRLPGIGEKRAQEIATWREEHGPFETVEELMEVPGIGPGILEGLREYAATGNE